MRVLGFVLSLTGVGLGGLEWDPTQLTRTGWLMSEWIGFVPFLGFGCYIGSHAVTREAGSSYLLGTAKCCNLHLLYETYKGLLLVSFLDSLCLEFAKFKICPLKWVYKTQLFVGGFIAGGFIAGGFKFQDFIDFLGHVWHMNEDEGFPHPLPHPLHA